MKKQEYRHITQPFPPVFNARSRILILGSLPSVQSREGGFYYHHPRNRFWSVLAALLREPVPVSIPEKRDLLLRREIALWDVIESCDIIGSSDASIRNVVPADLTRITKHAPIRSVYTNGGTANRLYQKYEFPLTGLPAVSLPSTSPANASYSLEKLTAVWGERMNLP